MLFSAAENWSRRLDQTQVSWVRKLKNYKYSKLNYVKTARTSHMIFTVARSESMNRSREIRKRLFIMMEKRERILIGSWGQKSQDHWLKWFCEIEADQLNYSYLRSNAIYVFSCTRQPIFQLTTVESAFICIWLAVLCDWIYCSVQKLFLISCWKQAKSHFIAYFLAEIEGTVLYTWWP